MEDAPKDGLNRRMTGREHGSGIKKRRMAPADESSDDEDDEIDIEEEKVESAHRHHLSFVPLHLISVWQEPGTMTKCLSVAILLPSGIGEGDFAWRVIGEGHVLEISVIWPPPLQQPEIMHKKWLNKDNREGFEMYHPKVVGFQLALKQLRKRNSDMVESVARIMLPFPVQAHVRSHHNMAWVESSVRMVYLDLMAVVDEYAHENNKEAFEVVE